MKVETIKTRKIKPYKVEFYLYGKRVTLTNTELRAKYFVRRQRMLDFLEDTFSILIYIGVLGVIGFTTVKFILSVLYNSRAMNTGLLSAIVISAVVGIASSVGLEIVMDRNR